MTQAGPESFDGVAAIYDDARPSYPREAVEFLVPRDARSVVDVGAGTGKFTALLGAPGREVIAIEPSAEMLDALRAAVPGGRAEQGSGERMPLPDAYADVVTFAQAWHWVDAAAATAEAARVLRPGGLLGLTWNLRDERVGWVRELGAAMRADGDHFRGEGDEDPRVDPPFGEPERHHVEWVRICARDDILADVRSRSYFPLLSSAEQADVLEAVRAVLDARGRGAIELPYVTASFRYARP